MSKKNLARSAIEGGRRPYNKFDRGQSNREQRAAEREYLGRAQADDEYSDNRVIEKRRKVRKEFDDKLGPMYRWLRSHVGQRWDEVRAKAKATYDSRTTAGRHILYDHLFSSVQVTPEPDERWRSYNFYVDDDGILRLGEKNRWNRKTWYRNPDDANYIRVSSEALYRWAASRKVIDYGEVQFWTRAPTRFGWRLCMHRGYRQNCPYKSKQVPVDKPIYDYWARAAATTLEQLSPRQRVGAFVKNGQVFTRGYEWHCFGALDVSLAQGDKFSKEEAEFWRKLNPRDRRLLIQESADMKRKMREEMKRKKR